MRMIGSNLVVLVVTLSLTAHIAAKEATPAVMEHTVHGLIARKTPNLKDKFIVEIPEIVEDDYFILSQPQNGKIKITASNGVSAASGFLHYLREILQSSDSWVGHNLDYAWSLTELPPLEEEIRKDRYFKWSYNFNPTAAGYSTVWWDWKDWEEHIDYMAMRGVNIPLMIVGHEYVWAHTFMQFGVTMDDMEKFFSGPVYLPWQRMGNFRGLAGPLTTQWMTEKFEIARKVFDRMRAFGMKPVLPGFSGRVPSKFKDIVRDNDEIGETETQWNDYFPNHPEYTHTSLLLPTSELFAEIAEVHVKTLVKLFGPNDHYYNVDIYNENEPRDLAPEYLITVAQTISSAMQRGDEKAIWVMQGWAFLSGWKFWKTPGLKEAFLGAVDNDRMLILELSGDSFPQWGWTSDYYGKQYIWCELLNFGGNFLVTGRSPTVMNTPYELKATGHTIVGIGATPEGLFTNEIMFDMVFDHAWSDKPSPIVDWVNHYLVSRYGASNETMNSGWATLMGTAFNYPVVFLPKARLILRPNLSPPEAFYDHCLYIDGWENILKGGEAFANISTYRFDLIDITRQGLSNLFDGWFFEFVYHYKDRDACTLQNYRERMLGLLGDMDDLLATHERFMLGRWMHDAERWAANKAEIDNLRTNARYINTLWTPAGIVGDYAAKQWSGMVKDFYLPRWEIFFDQVLKDLQQKKDVDQVVVNQRVDESDRKWVDNHKHYPNVPTGDTYTIAKRIWDKYGEAARASCDHYEPKLPQN